MEYRDPGKLQVTLLRYDIHIVAGLFVLQYIPDYLALTIIRLYNGRLNEQVDERITFKRNLKKVELVNLKEETKTPLKIEDGQVVIEGVGHSKFVTVYVELE